MLRSYFSSLIIYLKKVSITSISYVRLLKKKLNLVLPINNSFTLRNQYQTLQTLYDERLLELIELEEELSYLKDKNSFSTQLIHDQKNEIQRLQNRLVSSISLEKPLQQIKENWIEYHIHQINQAAYGAGQVYELYEARKQSAINRLIRQNQANLTPLEVDLIKRKTDYQADFEPYTEINQETGEVLAVIQVAQRMADGLV